MHPYPPLEVGFLARLGLLAFHHEHLQTPPHRQSFEELVLGLFVDLSLRLVGAGDPEGRGSLAVGRLVGVGENRQPPVFAVAGCLEYFGVAERDELRRAEGTKEGG